MTTSFPRPELLLHPNIPKPLHGLNPRTIMGEVKWYEVRRVAYARHGFHCFACGVAKAQAAYHKWLEAHEDYSVDYERGRVEIREIVALCHACHNFIHSGRMLAMASKSDVPASRVWEILQHGFRVLAHAKLKLNPFAVQVALQLAEMSTPPAWADASKLRQRLEPMPASSVSWSAWRLVFDGVEYKPLWPTYEAWLKHYS